MDEHVGLQKAESPIPKLTDKVREKIEAADEARQADPQVRLIEDALTRLTELLEDWTSVWISPPWRSEQSIAADKSERPGRLRVQSDGTVIIGEGARNIRQLIATSQLQVFEILDLVTKAPHEFPEFTSQHKRVGRPYFELSKFVPERFEYFSPQYDNWTRTIKFLQTQLKDTPNGTTSTT